MMLTCWGDYQHNKGLLFSGTNIHVIKKLNNSEIFDQTICLKLIEVRGVGPTGREAGNVPGYLWDFFFFFFFSDHFDQKQQQKTVISTRG